MIEAEVSREAASKSVKKRSESLARLLLWSLLLVVWTAAVIVAVQFLLSYIFVWILGRETAAMPMPTAVYSAVTYMLAFVILWLVTPLLAKLVKKPARYMNRKELGLAGLPTWADIGLGILGFVASMLLAAGLTELFKVFPWFNSEQTQSLGFNPYVEGVDRFVAFITLTVVAPICEELIFRGWLYGKLRGRFGQSRRMSGKAGRMVAVILPMLLASLLFAILHGQWNVGVIVFAMSMVMCLLRELTGTIYAGMLVHIIKNVLAFYLVYVAGL